MFFEPWMPFFAPKIRLPASGDLNFGYSPHTEWEAPSLFRGDEQIEQAVYTGIASPGKQLGTIINVLDELASKQNLKSDERDKLAILKQRIDQLKESVATDDEEDARKALDRLRSKDPKRLARLVEKFGSED